MDRDVARDDALTRLKRPLRLTRAGMLAERLTRCFWPVWSIAFAFLAAILLGLPEMLPLEPVWIGTIAALAGMLWFAVRGALRFRWPGRAEALARLDATLPGRPLQALGDTQAIGAADEASVAVWSAHQGRMAARASQARPVPPDLVLNARDPYALRYVALTALAVALLFGSFWRVATVGQIVAPAGTAGLAAGPAWEGWVEPPAYTGKPTIYLNDIEAGPLGAPRGSVVTLRLYGEVGALSVDETVSGRAGDTVGPATAPAQEFSIEKDGRLAIRGDGGREWRVRISLDTPPEISLDGLPEVEAAGRMKQRFSARDDIGVIAGTARIELDLEAVVRSFGLVADPDPREAIVLDLPMPVSGSRAEFSETLVEDFSKHTWVGLPVRITLSAEDAAGQHGHSEPLETALSGRRFFDPLAAALVEQRRDLLWARQNGARVAQILRAVTYRPEDVFRDAASYLPLRVAIRRLEAGVAASGGLTPALQDEIAEALWNIALKIEEGDLSDALERLRRAQDRLSEAIRNGATDEEIAALMDELRQAMQEYMRQLAQQDPGQQQAMPENAQTITADQLQQLLDRLQQLMEEGRTAEAMALLEQLQMMMENMQVARGQGGQGGPGEQAMQDLAETLRDQQGLSDEAFRELQEQFDGGRQPGQPGDGMRGQSGREPGDGSREERPPGQSGAPDAGSLAERQGALGRRLDDLRENLPGAGSEAGDAAREALGRAGEAMSDAEGALEDGDLAGALDDQSRAMEAMREGMRNLGEALAQQRQQGGQGQQTGNADNGLRRDPLGREVGNSGSLGTEDSLLPGEDIYRRAHDLLEEIRRRASDRERPPAELDYLRRLLDRF
ncbi:TIGR02302 family protein [Tropicimonas sp.]|uniref:TIGR02302 family protein n=1 Tax=Tropicimonas sp. TaxID=2067044 RepID=UPI003A88F1BC